MDSLSDQVTKKLEDLNALRERFVIRVESLPADLALVGLLDELREAAFSTLQLCRLHTKQAAFPLARVAFEAAQRLIVLATDDDYVRVGARAWLYYLRKDMRVVQFARDADTAREWYERGMQELLHIWSAHNPTAEAIFREANEQLDMFQKGRKADNFMGEDLGQVLAGRYSKLAIGSGRSVAELRGLNRGIYTGLSRESHARLRLDPAALRVSPDGTVTVVPRKVDEIAKSKIVLGCLDSSLAEASAALAYLTKRRQQERSEQLRLVAADLTQEPLPPNFKPDLGLHLMRQGGAATTFHFPSVPIRELGILPDGTVTWSGNLTFGVGEVYIATFDVPRSLTSELARALGIERALLAPDTQVKKLSFKEPFFLFLDCTLGEIQESPGGSFAPFIVVKVAPCRDCPDLR